MPMIQQIQFWTTLLPFKGGSKALANDSTEWVIDIKQVDNCFRQWLCGFTGVYKCLTEDLMTTEAIYTSVEKGVSIKH